MLRVRPTSKRWFLERVHMTMKHYPFLPCKNPHRLYLHLAFTYSGGPSSVERSELWTSSAFSTNDNAWSLMVTGFQFRVWVKGPSNNLPPWIMAIQIRTSTLSSKLVHKFTLRAGPGAAISWPAQSPFGQIIHSCNVNPSQLLHIIQPTFEQMRG
jgi:hypothetical protein